MSAYNYNCIYVCTYVCVGCVPSDSAAWHSLVRLYDTSLIPTTTTMNQGGVRVAQIFLSGSNDSKVKLVGLRLTYAVNPSDILVAPSSQEAAGIVAVSFAVVCMYVGLDVCQVLRHINSHHIFLPISLVAFYLVLLLISPYTPALSLTHSLVAISSSSFCMCGRCDKLSPVSNDPPYQLI